MLDLKQFLKEFEDTYFRDINFSGYYKFFYDFIERYYNCCSFEYQKNKLICYFKHIELEVKFIINFIDIYNIINMLSINFKLFLKFQLGSMEYIFDDFKGNMDYIRIKNFLSLVCVMQYVIDFYNDFYEFIPTIRHYIDDSKYLNDIDSDEYIRLVALDLIDSKLYEFNNVKNFYKFFDVCHHLKDAFINTDCEYTTVKLPTYNNLKHFIKIFDNYDFIELRTLVK